MKKLDIMKKMVCVLMLLSALSLQAQTSRIMLGLGGGLSLSLADGRGDNICGPMGTFNFGYSILGNVDEDCMVGLRTGVNATYSRFGDARKMSESFTNVDYYGHQMEYSVTSSSVRLMMNQVDLEVPVMLSLCANGLYINLGAKFKFPVWNRYRQTIEDPHVSVFYPEYGVTVDNDIVTGLLSDEQVNASGRAAMPVMKIGVGAEIGHVWQIKESKSSLGFDLFFDFTPFGVGGIKKGEEGKSVVEIAPIENDCEQPMAEVTVNPLTECNGYKFKTLNFGVKLVYTFDAEHKKK